VSAYGVIFNKGASVCLCVCVCGQRCICFIITLLQLETNCVMIKCVGAHTYVCITHK
jgi:hypothetical protein